MRKEIRKILTINLGLKLLAGICAVILWVIVVTINDPTMVLTYTTSVTLKNQEYITEQNKYFEELSGSNIVRFTVTAKRSIQEQITGADFTAVADMKRGEYDEETGRYRVPIIITTDKYNDSSVTIANRQSHIEVALEDLGRVQKAVLATTTGTVAEGFALGNVEIVGSNLLQISGPNSIVSRIDKVVADIDVDGMSTDITYSSVPVFYDKNGNTIDPTKLTINMSTVAVSAEILNTKEVTLEFSTMGKPVNGYVMMGVNYEPTTVLIKGRAATLNPINKITIPAEVLNLNNLKADLVTRVDISAYLPEGTALVNKADAKVDVTVDIDPIVTKTYEVPLSNFTIVNLRNGYTVQIIANNQTTNRNDVIEISVTGAESDIKLLQAEDIQGVINLTGLWTGSHRVNVDVQLNKQLYTLTNAVTVTAKLTMK